MKKPNSVGYFSSYDRGLECLLNMWPEIRKQVPEATLDIFYGWDTFDKVHRNNPEMMKWKLHMTKLMRQPGVTEHGRVSHTELAKAMKTIQVWAYPTEFTEIHCITALKAQAAGCWPVVTGVAALNETVDYGDTLATEHIYTDKEQQNEFIKLVVDALKRCTAGKIKGDRYDYLHNTYWPDVAKVWSEAMA